jgi:tetratricopeptide (TPR) repeat protein
MSTTAQHLAHWAIYLSGIEGNKDHLTQDVASLVVRALEVSPVNPTARLARAQIDHPEAKAPLSTGSLGLSRDGVSLAWSSRRLLAAGKPEASLKLFGQALLVASRGGLSRSVAPRFNDDPGARRYLLPREERVREIVSDLIARNEWTFHQWSRALPNDATVLLATARLLREQGRSETEELLDRVLDVTGQPAGDGEARAQARAARAEVFAMRSQWQDAEQEYRQAIELIDNDLVRRSWWFNLADIAFRLNNEGQRQTALRAALAVATSDDITRRATGIQRSVGVRSRLRFGGPKAN